MNEEIKILFEDEYLCVIDKPAGWVVNDAESVKTLTVQEWFKNKILRLEEFKEQEFGQKGGVVHRLDKDTSGVMVLAKTLEAYEGLKEQFLTRKTQKVYLALVHGVWNEQMGLISLPIERFSKNKSKFAVGTDLSKTAVTEWIQKEMFKDNKSDKYALMELHPHTGRTHQLRVHMQHFGHPIVSDPIYGWKKHLKNDLAWCPRLFLHATSLEFTHPMTNEKKKFDSELPADLAQAVKTLVH